MFDLRERYRHSSWMTSPRMRAWFTLCHRETSQGTWLAARHGAADGIGTPRGGLILRGHHGQRRLVQRHPAAQLAGLRRHHLDLDACVVRVSVSTAETDDGRLIDDDRSPAPVSERSHFRGTSCPSCAGTWSASPRPPTTAWSSSARWAGGCGGRTSAGSGSGREPSRADGTHGPYQLTRCPDHAADLGRDNWSGRRESNPHDQLGRRTAHSRHAR